MREQQRCFLEDPSHVRKRGAPRGGSYQTAPTGGFSSARDDGETLRIGARGRAGELGMYWDFGDEPPGLYCKRGHGAFPPLYRIVLTVDGEFDGEFFEEEEAWIVNIRCQLCTLVRRCPECSGRSSPSCRRKECSLGLVALTVSVFGIVMRIAPV